MEAVVITVHICELDPAIQVSPIRYRTGTEETYDVMVCGAVMVV